MLFHRKSVSCTRNRAKDPTGSHSSANAPTCDRSVYHMENTLTGGAYHAPGSNMDDSGFNHSSSIVVRRLAQKWTTLDSTIVRVLL